MSFTVTVESSGEQFHCDADTNVLAAMEHARCHGIPVGCRNGGCGRAVVSAEEDAQGCVLACKTCPQGDIKVKALGRVWNAATAYKGALFSFGFAMRAPITQPDKET